MNPEKVFKMMLTFQNPVFLIALSALGYALATLAMKHMADTPSIWPLIFIIGFFALAILFEVIVLRQENLAFTYVAILALEAMLVVVISVFIGETLSMREITGGVIVLIGAAILWG
ncbi:hypothetical protein BFP76_10835 [Amylibacter kogurei]|uniref:5-aminolevulinate synthase n=2 Tax=Paramylibacter kogurei TaxID=1889778 RepID=A0A2G5KDR1_9RHOB|nr:hypothetical protein BFP76_10835 [Amylibacter kogurei]